MAGKDWSYGFRVRHPQISLRKPEGLSSSRAEAFNEERIENYFEALTEIIGENFDPRLIFNADETGLSSVPNTTGKVLAQKGVRAVSCVEVGERGVLTTTVPCVSAAGELMPPFIVFKGKRKDKNLQTALEKHGIHAEMSESGFIDKTIFLKFLNFFQAKRPNPDERCILIVDGHTSHTGIDVLTYAAEHKIDLLCIPPHTSHRLQPLDTHWNGPLKRLWEKLVRQHLRDTSVVRLNRFEFMTLLSAAWKEMSEKRHLIIKGFQHCGIFPLKRVVSESEFEISKSFTSDDDSQTKIQRRSSQKSLEKCIFPSPVKKASSAHKRSHTTLLTSPENIASKKMKKEKSTRKPASDKERADHRRTMRLPTWMNNPSSTAIDVPSTSGIQMKPFESTSKKQSSCNSCGEMWLSSMLDFYKCVDCSKWYCEECFEVERCMNCLEVL